MIHQVGLPMHPSSSVYTLQCLVNNTYNFTSDHVLHQPWKDRPVLGVNMLLLHGVLRILRACHVYEIDYLLYTVFDDLLCKSPLHDIGLDGSAGSWFRIAWITTPRINNSLFTPVQASYSLF